MGVVERFGGIDVGLDGGIGRFDGAGLPFCIDPRFGGSFSFNREWIDVWDVF